MRTKHDAAQVCGLSRQTATKVRRWRQDASHEAVAHLVDLAAEDSARLGRYGYIGECIVLAPTVLIIDEDAPFRQALGCSLRKRGLVACDATSGAEALGLLAALRPSAFVIDLPTILDLGEQEADVLRQAIRTADGSAFPVSACVNYHCLRACHSLGLRTFVRKPVSPAYLAERIAATTRADGSPEVDGLTAEVGSAPR